MDVDDLQWGPAEEGRMRALGGESPLPAGLEERTVAALRARGLLRSRRGDALRATWLWAAAAALVLLAGGAGFALGRARPVAAVAGPSAPRFLLLLHEDAGYQVAVGDAAHRERVAEYSRWAHELASRGQLVGGDELGASGYWIVGDDAQEIGPGGDHVAGYFILSAPNEAAALALGRGCPHLRHGGRIELRPVL